MFERNFCIVYIIEGIFAGFHLSLLELMVQIKTRLKVDVS